ncbi:MAG: dihydroorotate dehydrogenase [Pararhodobacter sp.]
MSTDQNRPGAFDEAALEALFAEARAEAPGPVSGALHARLVAAALEARPVETRSGWWARLQAALSDIGGMPSLAGVGAAGLAGIWIGFAAPLPTADLVSSVWPGAGLDWAGETGLDYAGSDLLTLLDSDTE